MNIKLSKKNKGIGLLAAIILLFVIVLISAYVIGCIIKLARKLDDKDKQDNNIIIPMMTSEAVQNVVNVQTGEIVSLTKVMGDSVRNGTTNSIMVQRWFPDGQPEKYLYTTNISWFQEFGVEDPNPPPDMGFYHIYIVAP